MFANKNEVQSYKAHSHRTEDLLWTVGKTTRRIFKTMERASLPSVSLRLKIGEAERSCVVLLEDTVQRFKNAQFPAESVRVIYQGRELSDNSSFRELRLPNRATLHIVPRLRHSNHNPLNISRNLFPEPEMDPCVVLAIFIGLTILLGLMLAFSIPEIFTSFSIILLASYSVFGISLISYIVKHRI